MAVSVGLTKLLDRAYEDLSLDKIVNAPVSALAGVTEDTAQMLKKAFGIKTVADLGRNKFFRAAVTLTELAEIADK
jgi:hypothetical protein